LLFFSCVNLNHVLSKSRPGSVAAADMLIMEHWCFLLERFTKNRYIVHVCVCVCVCVYVSVCYLQTTEHVSAAGRKSKHELWRQSRQSI